MALKHLLFYLIFILTKNTSLSRKAFFFFLYSRKQEFSLQSLLVTTTSCLIEKLYLSVSDNLIFIDDRNCVVVTFFSLILIIWRINLLKEGWHPGKTHAVIAWLY